MVRIIRRFLTADSMICPVNLGKVDLIKTYTRIWVRIKDTQSVDFLIPKKCLEHKQLVGFDLSLPMGYVYRALY